MTVDVVNINDRDVKRHVISLFEKANNITVTGDTDNLGLLQVTDAESMLQDMSTRNGVLFKKIPLGSILPKTLDLRPFKTKTEGKAPELQPKDVSAFNTKYGSELVAEEKDILSGQTPFTVEQVKDFVLFCRVFGFFELDISDVTLIHYDGVMNITPNHTHKLYTGSIEVLV